MTKRQREKYEKIRAANVAKLEAAQERRFERLLAVIVSWNDDYALEHAGGLGWHRNRMDTLHANAAHARCWLAHRYASMSGLPEAAHQGVK
jgi:hypothetical protein